VPTTAWTQSGRAPQGPGRAPAGARGPQARTGRDLGVLAVVVVVLGALVHAGASRQYPVPVSLGNATITNARQVLDSADRQFGDLVDAQATRVSRDARCYFWRPLGPTQGAVAGAALPAGLLPGDEKPDAIDIILCGPVEISSGAAPLGLGKDDPPWVSGFVYYHANQGGTSLRGKVKTMLAIPLPVLAATGGARAGTLLRADGHHPSARSITHPRWRTVTPTGATPPGGGTGLPPGITVPPGVSVPTLPPGITVPPGVSVPTLPPVTLPPGMTLPPGVTLPGGGG